MKPLLGTIDKKPISYGFYQLEIYAAGLLSGTKPLVTTDPNKLEAQARQNLEPKYFNYLAGGAGEGSTVEANRLAFKQWKMIPRMLRDVTTEKDLSINLFGDSYPHPIMMAPIGVQGIFHPDKETGVAEVCEELGVPFILSTAATSTIEEVAEANRKGNRFFQLYWPNSNDLTQSLLKRAQENGYKVLVVTLDTITLAWRPADLDAAYIPFISGTGNQIGFSDPVFRARFLEKSGLTPEDKVFEASLEWLSSIYGRSHTWEEIALLREVWKGPIVLKGIQSVEDAQFAVQAGCDGIIVSNHGGRQLDGAIGSLEVLPEIVDAVGSKLEVLFDSGVKTGVDIIKALCLGAKAVLVGRPVMYGLAIGGKMGAKNVLQGLLADLDQSMSLAGIKNIQACCRLHDSSTR
ncbi:oxidoreductase [Sclerotinia borealis F-4128]|uniref:Oxidoreductase n=1 Tax=Sclerotinia borealis (strain F-4128) TaxID=1432307 RepID=W9CBN0_SCLBF|nr:oxidoreductase [Sclerotinia borealis F-4128]